MMCHKFQVDWLNSFEENISTKDLFTLSDFKIHDGCLNSAEFCSHKGAVYQVRSSWAKQSALSSGKFIMHLCILLNTDMHANHAFTPRIQGENRLIGEVIVLVNYCSQTGENIMLVIQGGPYS